MKVLSSRPTPFGRLRTISMPKNIPRTGKRLRPKTAVKGKRYLCAKCRKRSPKPVKTPAPWYCARCLAAMAEKEAVDQ